MSDFYSEKRAKAISDYIFASEDPIPLMRLKRVQQRKLTHQMMHAIEMTKIDLSEKLQADLALPFIETSLNITLQREQIAQTMSNWLEKMFVMIDDAIKEAGKDPKIIYLTGGMGLSPLVQEAIKAHYPNVEINVADAFSSVVFGALLKAKRLYS
ncbi:Hsp70 family protein [Psychromonas sp. KJ10-10]|uniref:Hsp70 family protein n=1 Tax=Psychromonas sp. KJ10-10 TaxID=3391823 RepID=UPI0039B5A431